MAAFATDEIGETIALLAFMRGAGGSVTPNAAWLQPAWFIDPLNVTGLAKDSNDGAAPSTPVRTFTGGVLERFQTYAPRLPQTTVLHWLSSGVSADPVVFSPIITGGAGVTLLGTLQPLHGTPTATLGSFTPQNRAAGTPNTVHVNGMTWVPGTIVRDLTAGATFTIDADLGGGDARITAPIAFPVVFNPVSTPLSPGDSLALYAPTSIFCEKVSPTGGGLFIDNVNITGNAVAQLTSFVIVRESTVSGCLLQSISTAPNSPPTFIGAWFQDRFGGAAFSGNATIWGGALNGAGNLFTSGSQLDYDVLVNLRAHYDGTLTLGGAYFGQWPTNTIPTQTFGNVVLQAGSSGVVAAWGPATISPSTGQQIAVRGVTAANALLCTGGVTIDGVGTAFPFNPAASPPGFSAAVATTPANIDTYKSLQNPVTGTRIFVT